MLAAIAYHVVIPFFFATLCRNRVRYSERPKLWGAMRSLCNAISLPILIGLGYSETTVLEFALAYVFFDSFAHFAGSPLEFMASFNFLHHCSMAGILWIGYTKEVPHELIDAFLLMECSTIVLGARRLLSLFGHSKTLWHTFTRLLFSPLFIYFRIVAPYDHMQMVRETAVFQDLDRIEQLVVYSICAVQFVFIGPVIYDWFMAWLDLSCSRKEMQLLNRLPYEGDKNV